jgi:hypothetical protein
VPADRIPLGYDEDEDASDDGPSLGPDERDRDLLDGSWEQEHYAGRQKRRDWNAILVGVSLLVLLAMLIPFVLNLTN